MQAVLLGGAAGAFVRPDELATPLTFEDTRRIGATLGSGVVMVFDDTTALLPVLARIAAFFRDESCGQCVPCRVGTVRQEELVTRLVRGRPLGSVAQERRLQDELGQAMRDASICGLGQTASSAITSAFEKLALLAGGPMRSLPLAPPARAVELTVDGAKVSVREGATLLDACKVAGVATPTLCFAENLTPVNVCRVCVVELQGARTLVPACSRRAEPGMVVQTDSERVRLSRRLVLELLASSVDSRAPRRRCAAT